MNKFDPSFFNVKQINSIEDLKDESIKSEIENFINSLIPNMKLADTSNENMWLTIEFLKNINKSSPFISEQQKYIYILTRLDGKSRMRELGVSDDMYQNMEKAKEWRDKINKYVHPDKGGNNEAFHELDKIYKTLIDVDGE